MYCVCGSALLCLCLCVCLCVCVICLSVYIERYMNVYVFDRRKFHWPGLILPWLTTSTGCVQERGRCIVGQLPTFHWRKTSI